MTDEATSAPQAPRLASMTVRVGDSLESIITNARVVFSLWPSPQIVVHEITAGRLTFVLHETPPKQDG